MEGGVKYSSLSQQPLNLETIYRRLVISMHLWVMVVSFQSSHFTSLRFTFTTRPSAPRPTCRVRLDRIQDKVGVT